jgi:MoxR-like ATPase
VDSTALSAPVAQHPVVTSVRAIEDDLNGFLISRRAEIRGAFLALAAQQHVFYLGNPGSGKSYLVFEVCRRIRGDDTIFFPIEFNSFILREEIFGPISLSAMREHDSLARKYMGFLPSASVAQLDELWKAPPSLLNTLLRILNEREFRNDTEMIRSPLITAFATSYELPPPDRSLDALYDRILLRYESAPLKRTEDRKLASSLRLAKRAFEVEINSIADDLAALRARKTAESDAALVAASVARQTEAEAALRVLYSAKLHSEEERVAALPPEESEFERRRMRDGLRREAATEVAASRDEEAKRLGRERSELAARSYTEGLPRSIAHADTWLINNFGEYFSDEALIRAIIDDSGMPALGAYDTPDVRDLLRRVARWCVKRNYVAAYHKFLSRRDLDTLHSLVLGVTFPAEVEAAFYRILDDLPSVRSVRRETDLRLVIAAQAVLEGRTSASVEDLAVMKHVLWDRLDDQKTVNEAVNKETIELERELEALAQTISSWEHELTDELDVDYGTYSAKIAQREHELNRYKAVLEAHPNSPDLKAMLDRAEKLYHDYELAVMGRTGAANLNPFDLG